MDTTLKWKDGKSLEANGTRKQASVAIHISDKIDLRLKSVRRKKEHFILIKGMINQEDITILNINALNFWTFSFIKIML